MKRKKMWVLSSAGKSKVKLTDWKKNEIENNCQPLIKRFKQQFIKENPNKQFNYLTDIYTKWRGNYLYFCEKFKSEQPGRIEQEFEESFVRLECLGKDYFKLSYFRHTGQWFLVASSLTLNDYLEMIESIPALHPTG